MVTVSWRFGRGGEAGLPALRDADPWLTGSERPRATAFKITKRRDDWLVGRLNLKALLVSLVEVRYGQRCLPCHIEVARLPSGAPSVQLSPDSPRIGPFDPGQGLPLSVSNSHSNGAALAAAVWTDGSALDGCAPEPQAISYRADTSFRIAGPDATRTRLAVGADLELVEPRSDGFIRDFLTRDERIYCGATSAEVRDLRANLVWSAKEAVLKVLQLGLSADTWWLTCLPDDAHAGAWESDAPARAGGAGPGVILSPEPDAWRAFQVACDPRLGADDIAFSGRWRVLDGFVATVAVGARTEPAHQSGSGL